MQLVTIQLRHFVISIFNVKFNYGNSKRIVFFLCEFVWNYLEEKFLKRTLKLDRLNSDPKYLCKKIREAFPELPAGDEVGELGHLFKLCGNRTELIPLPVDINNAQALLGSDELNRSCVYIKADVSTNAKY